jgi:hypothetical protein
MDLSKHQKTFLHSGARGDIIYSLPTIKGLGGGILYIEVTGKHCVGKAIEEVDVEYFKGLLTKLDYIDDVLPWKGERVWYDLNDFRIKGGSLSYGHLAQNHLNAFNVKFDLQNEPFINRENLNKKFLSNIIINHSKRYEGCIKNWHDLKEYEEMCSFVGFEDEYENFKNLSGLNINFYKAQSYLEIAEIINASKVFIGNQSFIYSIAEGMKVNRFLSICDWVPNVGLTKNAYRNLNKGLVNIFLKQ